MIKSEIFEKSLLNDYYFMRHGESTANIEHIIVSDPEHGITSYGLTENGVEQVKKALTEYSRYNHISNIISSDFLRARDTALIAAECFGCPLDFSVKLRERFFGNYNMMSDMNYQRVWENDRNKLPTDSVESLDMVLTRSMELLAECEKKLSGKSILLISHGDIIQITLAYLKGLTPYEHRTIESVKNAEIRKISFPDIL